MPPADQLMPALHDTLYSGQIGEGAKVLEFERQFAQWLGHENVVACSSGTAALHIALMLAGVRPGDEVVSTALTAEPTNMAICHAGAVPIFADVDRRNGLITSDTITPIISNRCAAIMAVDYAGIPVAIDGLRVVADKHGLPIIEDAAQSLGAKLRGQNIGSLADFTVFSFQAIKHITTGDGGMLVLKDKDLLSRARKLRWFGLERGVDRAKVNALDVGYKYNMNNIAATLGLAQIPHFDNVIGRHIDNGHFYDRAFQNQAHFWSASWDQSVEPCYWVYSLLCEDRQKIADRLTAAGIGWSYPHKRNDLHQIFSSQATPLPNLDTYFETVIHLPCGWWVSDHDRDRIAAAILAP
jgi:dTDP-4-amino-4,6-dideoxygalactose transaminase